VDVHAPGPPRRGRKLEEALLDAAWNVLAESGHAGFSYEAISARAATSRTVLYRRWPRRDDLLIAAVTRYWSAHPIEIPDTGRLRDDTLALLRNGNAARADMMILLSVQLAGYFQATGTSLRDLAGTLRPAGGPNPFETIVARAVGRGELADRPRGARVVGLPFDLLRHDMLMTMRSVPDAALVEIVDEVWLPLLTLPA
jgi:AcrR family transcriptional regulator